ncbi:MAG: hypothetical protein ACRD1A_04740 [Terriglobales bacterium]
MAHAANLVSLLILLMSLGGAVFTLAAVAHSRVQEADARQLNRLREEGYLPTDVSVMAEIETMRDQLRQMAPVICMRQDLVLDGYFLLLRIAARIEPSAEPLQHELGRLAAFQAARYRVALQRYEHFRLSGQLS